jgi:uncharacterized protein (TIGR02466 family)
MYNSFSEFLFPKQIIISDSDNFLSYRDHLINLCYREREKDPSGVKISNSGGWQSKSDYIHNSDDFDFLFEDLGGNLAHCMGAEFNMIENGNLTISNAWINISGKYNYNVQHIHPLSVISAVYYIKCPENCGNLLFLQDCNDTLDLEYRQNKIKDLAKMYSAYFITPQEGRLIIFPSNLSHRVETNMSDEDRISISFNMHLD